MYLTYTFTSFSQRTSVTEASVQRCSVKKVFLVISQNSQEYNCVRDSFLIKLQAKGCNFIKKEYLAQVFSCEFCEISRNTFFYRTPTVATSGVSKAVKGSYIYDVHKKNQFYKSIQRKNIFKN